MKAALVDVSTGDLISDRYRTETPQPATPDAMAVTIRNLVSEIEYIGPIGIGFPSVVWDGVCYTANNIDESWIGRNAGAVFGDALGQDVIVLNDADAAALAEAQFGVARGIDGLVVVLTFGTGIGSGLLVDGSLVPNVELGMIELDGHPRAEVHFAAKARSEEGLRWEEWGDRANRFLIHVNGFLSPQLIVIGGGAAKRWEKFRDRLDPGLPVELAAIRNNSGIVGAAVATKR